MRTLRKKTIKTTAEPFSVTSQFLKWYLCRDTLVRNPVLRRLLNRMDDHEVTNEGKWKRSLSIELTQESIRVLKRLLGRGLNHGELDLLHERIDGYIRSYTWGKSA